MLIYLKCGVFFFFLFSSTSPLTHTRRLSQTQHNAIFIAVVHWLIVMFGPFL